MILGNGNFDHFLMRIIMMMIIKKEKGTVLCEIKLFLC